MKKITLRLLAYLYRIGLLASQKSYKIFPFRVKKIEAHVISIGNITWGGTGKTPLVIRLAQDLSHFGKKVAVLTRGYGKDEVMELKKNLPNIPVLVGRNRVKTAREAVNRYGAEVLILDDGFQHMPLYRNKDVVVLNATLPFGPGGLIPQGTLREPLEHLNRAHLFVLSKSNLGHKNLHWLRQKIQMIQPGAFIFEAQHEPKRLFDARKNRSLDPRALKGKKVAALSAIGDPQSFEQTVENLGMEILFAARFDDHHIFSIFEIDRFLQSVRELGTREIITTAKDYVKLEKVLSRKKTADEFNFWVLEIEFQMNDEEDFIRRCTDISSR